MRLLIGKQELARVMAIVGRVVESRNTIPILGNVMLAAAGGGLAVAGADLDIVATASANADIEQDGAVCVDAKLFGDIVKKVGGDISISLEGDKLAVKSGRSRFSLATLPAVAFPTLPDGKYDATFDLDISALFAPVQFAIAVNDNRKFLEGVYFHTKNGVAVAVATNGHRLSRHIGESLPEFRGIIVGPKTVSLLPKGVARVSVSEQKIRVEQGDFTLISNLVDGEYPDYERVIPAGNEFIACADKSDILKASDRVATVSSERGSGVKLTVSSGSIALSVRSQVGAAQDEVQAEYSGEPIEIGFNAIYLRDALQVFPDGQVEIALNDGMSPARITSPVAPLLDVTLMPMRV
ncbi:DNA polymerase III subunit beta [Sinorhizobium medicae]